MDRLFKNVVICYNSKEILCKGSSKILLDIVRQWRHNRPPDMKRVEAIKEYISKTGIVDGTIYIAQIVGKDKSVTYDCFDGNHRRLALMELEDDYEVMVHILLKATHDEIKDRFIALNSSMPVPDLYMNDTPEERKEKIEYIVSKISDKWKKHQSSSRFCKRPNFIRDSLISNISSYFENLTFVKSKEEIVDDIFELNEKYGRGVHINFNNYGERCLKKCRKTGCYIFLKNFWEDLDVAVIDK